MTALWLLAYSLCADGLMEAATACLHSGFVWVRVCVCMCVGVDMGASGG